MKKRGSHVGVVLSFVIFITFIVFLYSIIEPAIKTPKEKQFILNNLKDMLIENSSETITATTINVSDINPNKDCINLPNVLTDIIGEGKENELLIKNNSDNILSYRVQGQGLLIEVGYNFNGFLKIYYSNSIERSPEFSGGGCHPVTDNDFTIGTVRTYENTFESKIIDLTQEYEDNYEDLKERLGVPDENDFGFSLLDSNYYLINETSETLPSTTVYVEEFLIQYVDENGNILSGFLIIRIW